MQSIHQKEQIYTFCYVLVMPYILYMLSVIVRFPMGLDFFVHVDEEYWSRVFTTRCIGAEFLLLDAFPGVNHIRGMY